MCNSKIISSLLVMLSLVYNVYGQNDTLVKPRKNEIGLNITPFVVSALGQEPSERPIELTYKRVFNNWAFRTNVSYSKLTNNPNIDRVDQILLADSLLSERFNSKKRESFTGGIGFEHRSHLRSGIYFVGGIDLVGRVSHRSDRLKETISKIDSIGYSATAHEFYHRTQLSSNSIYEEDINSVQIGAGISLGLLIPLGSRWWIQGQYYMAGLIGPTESRTIDKIEGTTENTRYSSVDFNSGPGLAQVAVFFRF